MMTSREIVRRTLDFESPERVARSFEPSDFAGAGCTAPTRATDWQAVGGGRWERTDEWGNLWARIDLTSTEFKILHFLARRPGWVFSRKQIVEAVHGMNYPATDRSVDFQIVGLRKKLGQAGSYIETVRGVGYRFKE